MNKKLWDLSFNICDKDNDLHFIYIWKENNNTGWFLQLSMLSWLGLYLMFVLVFHAFLKKKKLIKQEEDFFISPCLRCFIWTSYLEICHLHHHLQGKQTLWGSPKQTSKTHRKGFASAGLPSCVGGNQTLSFLRRRSKNLENTNGMNFWQLLAVRLTIKVTILNTLFCSSYYSMKSLMGIIINNCFRTQET